MSARAMFLTRNRSACSRRRFAFTARVLAFAMALEVVVGTGHVAASPGDAFSISAPAIGAAPPKAADIKAGDAGVSTQTGALTYGIPLAFPPGRNGMVPHLSLGYSSQAPIYGTLAAGWSLSIPTVSLDTTRGRLMQQSPSTPDKIYTSSMAGGRPFVAVSEPHDTDVAQTYRAMSDATFTRFERLIAGSDGTWRARAPDGMTYIFGQADHASTCTILSDEYAPLTTEIDSFGNQVRYFYAAGAANECVISSISWGKNDNAGVADFATATFSTSVTSGANCPSGTLVGAQTSYRTGTKIVTGASQIDSITITAYPPGLPSAPVHTRVYTLSYAPPAGGEQTTTCGALHAAYRTLYSVQESAWGTDSPRVDLPAVKFGYGSAQFGLSSAWATTTYASPPWPGLGYRYNLSWGYRFPGAGSSRPWPTVEAMLADIDGDGLVDRVVSSPQTINGRYTCGAAWYKNLGNLSFDGTARQIPLPTLKWGSASGCYASETSPHTYVGNVPESCSLNHQVTTYINSSAGTPMGICPSNGAACPGLCSPNLCPGSPFTCPSSSGASAGTDCGRYVTAGATYLAYRWMDYDGDGRVDLIASPAGGTAYNLQQGNGLPGCQPPAAEPDYLGAGGFPACPGTSYTANAIDGYSMCNGMYPWIIYLNHHGQFGLSSSSPVPDWIVYQPIPLETDNPDASLLSRPVSGLSGPVDIDGDGHDDAIYSAGTSAGVWNVYRYFADPNVIGPGSYVPANGTTPFTVSASTTETQPNLNISTSAVIQPVPGIQYSEPMTTVSFYDLTGDGLADRWVTTQNGDQTLGPTTLSTNDGTSLVAQSPTTLSQRPSNDGFVCPSNLCCAPNSTFWSGERYDMNRTLDLDLDGRQDLVQLAFSSQSGRPIVTSPAQGYLNEGGQFAGPFALYVEASSGGGAPSFAHVITARGTTDSQCTNYYDTDWWETRSDLTDLDGDGIPEAIDFGGNPYAEPTSLTISKLPTPTQPPRLLVSIDNGRGAVTTASYAAMTNSAVVEQHPDQGKTMPHTQWVVQSITTTDNLPTTAATTTTTSYHYKDPVFAKDDLLGYGFRGFEEVTTTGASGAKTVERYSYGVPIAGRPTSPDWSGRLVTSLVIPAEAPTEVRSIDETTWESRGLFCNPPPFAPNCLVTSFHATQVDHWTCNNGQDEAACRANTGTFTRTLKTLSALSSSIESSGPYLWKETSTRLQTSTAAQDGDRIADSTFLLAADATTYRMLPQTVVKSVVTSGVPVMYGKTAHTVDSTNRVLLTDELWVDTIDANRSITRRDYDLTTGNVTKRWKPVQNVGDGAYASYDYDSRKLFVAAEHLEVAGALNQSQELDYFYEYGTGTKLETQGPNVAYCATTNPPSCAPGAITKQDDRIVIDGLGRTLEHWEARSSSDGNSYTMAEVSTTSYNDTAYANNPATATSVHTESFVEGTILKKQTTELDGHGRPFRATLFSQGAAPADAVTTMAFRNDGTLASVTVPDPTANTTATVTFTYTFDSLGRPLTIRRPDASAPADQSGVDMSYDGLIATSTEHVGLAGGTPATTKTTKDALGRLIEVDEQLTTAPSVTWATTSYAYDAADNVRQVTEPGPSGIVTTMTHDFAGHRTSITRPGDRTWTYTYDKNGNLKTQLTPGYTNELDKPNYTTTILYDDLDRPSSKLLPPRSLSPADIDLFGVDHETFLWDYGVPGHTGNYRGKLVYWRTFNAGGTMKMQFTRTFNAQGEETMRGENFWGADYSLYRQIAHTYYVSGLVANTLFDDWVGGTSGYTTTLAHYDARGLPAYVFLSMQPSLGNANIGNETRNVAGLVTKRKTTLGSAYFESNWIYDKLGRVTSQQLNKTGAASVARQDLTYFGNDDPKTLEQYLGANHKTFTYGYDQRHQITSASEANSAYYSAGFTYGSAGRFTAASETSSLPPGSGVQPRSVSYQYASGTGTDPEEVTALVNTAAPYLPFASFQYDAIGNQTMKCLGTIALGVCGGESWAYVYDGKDQLRRATHFSNIGQLLGSEEYWYDGEGHRMTTVKRDASGNKTELIWWLEETEAHYDGAGVLQHVISYITEGTPIARVDRTGNTTLTWELLAHGLGGSTLAAVDSATMNTNASFSYTPFGEIIEATDSAGGQGIAAHRRRWNDKFVDEVSGLAYYGVRFYDRLSLTWTQGDPLFRFAPEARWTMPRNGNLYTFSLNNPLRYVDPDGRLASGSAEGPGPAASSIQSQADAIWHEKAAMESAYSDNWMLVRRQAILASGDGRYHGGFDMSQMCDGVHSVCEEGQSESSAEGPPVGPYSSYVDMTAHAAAADRASADHAVGSSISDGVGVGILLSFINAPAAVVAGAFIVLSGASAPDNTEGGAAFGACTAAIACYGGIPGGGTGSKAPRINPTTPVLTRGMGGRVLGSAEAAEFAAFGERAASTGLVESPYRTGSWGRVIDGRYTEVTRIDVGEAGKAGWRGETHMHINGGAEHLPLSTKLPGE